MNELRAAGITQVAAANAYLRERFLPDYNATFARAPADPTSVFVPVGEVDLDDILCEQEDRVVAADNTVTFGGVCLQLDKQRGRPTCAGWRVTVRRHLDASFSVWRGLHRLGRFTAGGRPLAPASPPRPRPPQERRTLLPLRGVLARRRPGPRLPVGPGL